jgi:catecholate siderophore receptor
MREASKHWLVVAGALIASSAVTGRVARAAEGRDGEEPLVLERILARRFDIASDSVDAAVLAAFQNREAHDATPAKGAAAATEPVRFQIPAGRLDAALSAFEEQSGYTVEIGNPLLNEISSKGVSGLYSPEKALEILLDGTSVAFEKKGPRAVLVQLRISEFVEVAEQREARPESRKYTEPLRDIPQTITIVPRTVIEDQNATTLRDVLRNVTGISMQAGEGGVPAGDNLSIRGFSARTDIFVDGFRDFGGYSRDPFNVEQVEVSKGPASTFAGRGSTGGTVNLASKAPVLESFQTASFGLGNAGYKRGTFDLNLPFQDFAVAGTSFRLNAMWTDSDVASRDVVTNQRFGFAPSLSLGLGTPTRLTVSYSRLGQDNLPDYGIPWVPADNVPLEEYRNQAPPVEFSNFYGLSARDYEDTTTDLATVDFEKDINPSVTLTNVVRYGRTDRDSVITSPRFESPTSTDIRRTDWKSRDQVDDLLGNQLNLVTRFETGSARHAVASGLELSSEGSINYTRVETGVEPGPTDLFDPHPADPYTGAIQRNGAFNESDALSTAVYAFDTVELDERWQVTGGLRWERFDLDYLTVTAEGVETPSGRVDEMLSWRAGLIHRPRSNGSIYLGAGTSFNPSSEGLTLSPATADVEPEKSFSIEAGTKWDLVSRRLGVSAAVFRTEKVNARTPGINPGDPPTVLDGKHRVDGIELGATGAPAEGWELFAGYTFMASEITESNNPLEVGNEFGNTPKHSLTVWSSHALSSRFEAGMGVRYVGDRYNNNTVTRLAPGYWLFDAMAAYRVNELLTLRLNGNNLGNATYIDRIGGGHFVPGDGRTLMLTASVDF